MYSYGRRAAREIDCAVRGGMGLSVATGPSCFVSSGNQAFQLCDHGTAASTAAEIRGPFRGDRSPSSWGLDTHPKSPRPEPLQRLTRRLAARSHLCGEGRRCFPATRAVLIMDDVGSCSVSSLPRTYISAIEAGKLEATMRFASAPPPYAAAPLPLPAVDAGISSGDRAASKHSHGLGRFDRMRAHGYITVTATHGSIGIAATTPPTTIGALTSHVCICLDKPGQNLHFRLLPHSPFDASRSQPQSSDCHISSNTQRKRCIICLTVLVAETCLKLMYIERRQEEKGEKGSRKQ